MLGNYSSMAFLASSGLNKISAGATVEVRAESDNSLANLFYDKDGLYASGNPITTDDNGFFSFYAAGTAEGYKITVTKSGNSTTLRNQPVGNSRYYDVDQLADVMGLGSAASPTFVMVTVTGTPSAGGDLVPLSYLQSYVQGFNAKANVRLGTTTNDSLSGLAARDGVTPLEGDRVLVKAQIYDYDNGIYIASSGAWTRATDMDIWDEVPGAYVFVEEGTTLADTGWLCTTNESSPPPAIGSAAINWTQFTGPGGFQPLDSELTAIAGLVSAADQVPYFTGSGAAALMTVTAAARTVLDDTTVAAMLATMGGLTSAQIAAAYQPLDADLTALALLSASSPETLGFISRQSGGGYSLRSIVAGSSKLSVTKGDGAGGNVSLDVVPSALAGRQTIFIPASAMTPRSANGCASLATSNGSTNQPDVPYLSFDGGSPQVKQYATFAVRMPKSWDEQPVTASFTFKRASGTGAANVVWGIRAVAVVDDDTYVQNFGADATVTAPASAVSANNLKLSGETGSCQIGTSSPPSAEPLVFFEVFRDNTAAADTLSVDAHLVGVTIYFNTNALTDA